LQLPVDEAARQLLALSSGSDAAAVRVLDALLYADARFLRIGSAVALAATPLAACPLDEARFAVLDLETTGLAQRSRVREVGIVVLGRGRLEEEFDLVIRSDGDRAIARRELYRHGAGAVVVGHNLAFDLSFVEREFLRPGDRIAAQTLDTLPLARRLLRGRSHRLTLAALAEFFDLASVPCHRALPDARATAEILLVLIGLARELGARTVGDICSLARLPTAARPARAVRPERARAPAGSLTAGRFRSIV
jgi:DNA polymerase III subunit epsilon